MIKRTVLFLGLCFFASNVMGSNVPAKKEFTPQEILQFKKLGRNWWASVAGFSFFPAYAIFGNMGPLASVSMALFVSSVCAQVSHGFHKDAEKMSKEMQPPVPFNTKCSWAAMAVNGGLGLASCVGIFLWDFYL